MAGNGLAIRGFNRAAGLLLGGFSNADTGTAAPTLVGGSISLVSVTSSSVSLSATEATGGTAPISHQWARATSLGGTYTNIGSNSLSLAATGLAASTTYYFKLTYTDSVGQTATATYSRTTSAASVSASFAPILYSPLVLTMANGAEPFALEDSENDRTLRLTISDSNAAADWTDADHVISQVDVALVSANQPQHVSNAAILLENVTSAAAGSGGVTVSAVFSQANIADLTGIIYYAYAVVLFASGQEAVFGRVRVERQGN